MSYRNQGRNWASPAKRARIHARDGYRCLYCNGKLGDPDIPYLTLDHIDPSYGQHDRNRDSNLASCCSRCNGIKGPKTLGQFLSYANQNGWRGGAAKRIRKRIAEAQNKSSHDTVLC